MSCLSPKTCTAPQAYVKYEAVPDDMNFDYSIVPDRFLQSASIHWGPPDEGNYIIALYSDTAITYNMSMVLTGCHSDWYVCMMMMSIHNSAKNGFCHEETIHGIVVTSCQCKRSMKVYFGYNCENQLLSDATYYIGLVVLTLSSIVALPAITYAYAHHLPFEATIYLSTAIVTVSYHLCLADDDMCYLFYFRSWYTLCYVLLYLCAFVTCVYLSDISPVDRSKWHVLLTLLAVLCVTDDPTSVSNFIFSVIIVILTIMIGSVMKVGNEPQNRVLCRTDSMVIVFPQVKLGPFICGMVVLIIGILMYILAESHLNYPFVHAAYQGCTFLALFLFLVSKEGRTREDMAARRSRSLLYRLYGAHDRTQMTYGDDEDVTYLSYEESRVAAGSIATPSKGRSSNPTLPTLSPLPPARPASGTNTSDTPLLQ